VKTPWPDGLVLVCRECDERGARHVAKALRRLVRHRLGSKRARVVLSTCLDVCPKHEVTLAIVLRGQVRCATVHDPAEAERKVTAALES
jgi:hypothetical protein